MRLISPTRRNTCAEGKHERGEGGRRDAMRKGERGRKGEGGEGPQGGRGRGAARGRGRGRLRSRSRKLRLPSLSSLPLPSPALRTPEPHSEPSFPHSILALPSPSPSPPPPPPPRGCDPRGGRHPTSLLPSRPLLRSIRRTPRRSGLRWCKRRGFRRRWSSRCAGSPQTRPGSPGIGGRGTARWRGPDAGGAPWRPETTQTRDLRTKKPRRKPAIGPPSHGTPARGRLRDRPRGPRAWTKRGERGEEGGGRPEPRVSPSRRDKPFFSPALSSPPPLPLPRTRARP